MERVTLLDTSVGTTNLGDEIIMRCFREEMRTFLEKYFVLTAPTHLSKLDTELEEKINSEFDTKVNVDFSAIEEWKAQFD